MQTELKPETVVTGSGIYSQPPWLCSNERQFGSEAHAYSQSEGVEPTPYQLFEMMRGRQHALVESVTNAEVSFACVSQNRGACIPLASVSSWTLMPPLSLSRCKLHTFSVFPNINDINLHLDEL